MTSSPQMSEFETPTVVTAVDRAADDVVLLTLESADGARLPAWTPGAHIDLILPGDLARQYSLCGSPSDAARYQVAVLRVPDGRGGSAAIHRLAVGDSLRVRGPRNHFPFVSRPRYVFIAGGIGITPMLPMIEAAEAAGAKWELHYAGRRESSMAFAKSLAERGPRVRLAPRDVTGRLDVGAILGAPQPGVAVYCCGPETLLRDVEERCEAWPAGTLHLERFAAKERADESGDEPFELVLQRSGATLTVEPGVSVFDTMRGAGVSVLGSCLEGVCGTCEQSVLEGEVDHRDSVLDEEEQAANDCMMVCVSRAIGPRIVLDA